MSQVAEILQEQRQFFGSNETKSLKFREEQLRTLKRLIVENEKRISAALREDLSKPELEIYATEVGFTLHELDLSLKNLERWARPKKVSTNLVNQPGKSRIFPEPYGVSLVISPWNYPFQLAMAPAIAALSAGNTVVLKPSELTPKTAEVLASIVNENFPKKYFHVITGGIETSQALLNQRFDKIFFTGSTEVGRIVAKAAAEHLTPVTLELGGKSPAIVMDDADLNVTARRILWGKCVNAGQTCVAPDYVLVSEKTKPRLIKALKKAYHQFFPSGLELGENFSSIVNEKHFERLKSYLEGAQIIQGGESDPERKYFEFTLIDGVSWDSPVMKEEIFGPILPLMIFQSLDDLIHQVKTQEKPLALYLFTSDESVKDKIRTELSFGGGAINETLMHLGNPDLPFGGVGQSGYGAYHGERGFLEFSHQKSILEKATWVDLPLRYPPYDNSKLAWIRKLLG